MPGPPKKPTKLRLLEGNPSKRPLNKEEPQPPPGNVVAPESVARDPVALSEWRRMTRALDQMGILGSVDHVGLAAYCTAHSDIEYHQSELLRLRVQLKRKRLSAEKRAELSDAHRRSQMSKNEALKIIKTFLVEFGLTPASRSRIDAQAAGAFTARGASDKPLQQNDEHFLFGANSAAG